MKNVLCFAFGVVGSESSKEDSVELSLVEGPIVPFPSMLLMLSRKESMDEEPRLLLGLLMAIIIELVK